MARQPVRPEPYLKHMEGYNTFRGLNTVDSESQMTDAELVQLKNIDLKERGTLKRRNGIRNHTRRAIWGDIKGKTWGDL